METHDHPSPVDTAIHREPSSAPTENMIARTPDTASVSPEPATPPISGQAPEGQPRTSPADAAQAPPVGETRIPEGQGEGAAQIPPAGQTRPLPGGAEQAAPVAPAPHPDTVAPEQPQDPAVAHEPQGQTAGQQPQFQPGVIMDPATGQLYYAMPQGQFVQPPSQNGQSLYHTTQAPPAEQTRPLPGDAEQAAPVDPAPHPDTVAPEQPQGPAVAHESQGQIAGQQPQFQPGVIMDSSTGQLYYAMPQGQFVQPPPQQPVEPRQPDYAEIVKSVEAFAEGEASVSDVVKTLWSETSQDDQFWKGAVAGAAAAVLLSSGVMGKTFGNLFGKGGGDAAASAASSASTESPGAAAP